jgi:hypothetical protein
LDKGKAKQGNPQMDLMFWWIDQLDQTDGFVHNGVQVDQLDQEGI